MAVRYDIITVARAKETLGATAGSAARKSTNNAYKTPHGSNEKPNSIAARRAQKVSEDIFPGAWAQKLLESVSVAARDQKEVLVSNFNHDIQDQIKMVRTARNSANTTARAMSPRVSKSNSCSPRVAQCMVANKKHLGSSLRGARGASIPSK